MKPEIHGGNIYKYDHKVYDFSANLNPLGMPEAAKQALVGNIDSYESYPDPDNRELKRVISRYHGVDEESICCGNGAADVIFRIVMAFKPSSALIIAPAFSEYGEALKLAGCDADYINLTEASGFSVPEDIAGRIKGYDMVFICNPANPTGIPVKREIILKMAEACSCSGSRLILDECFSDFLEEEEEYSVIDQIKLLPNVIILKSFTKIFAMAGLRLGYCICGSRADAEAVENCMQTWPVSTASAKAGAAAMENGIGETKQYVAKERARLIIGLDELGYKVFPSKANYVFFKSDIPLDEHLKAKGILIRNCANYHGLSQGYYRAAVRTKAENSILLSALRDIAEI